jgi:hypothetical protein
MCKKNTKGGEIKEKNGVKGIENDVLREEENTSWGWGRWGVVFRPK